MRNSKPLLIHDEIDAYLAAVPEPGRGTLEKIRATIRSAAPPETTEVISYCWSATPPSPITAVSSQ